MVHVVPGSGSFHEVHRRRRQAADSVGELVRLEAPVSGLVEILRFDEGDSELGCDWR